MDTIHLINKRRAEFHAACLAGIQHSSDPPADMACGEAHVHNIARSLKTIEDLTWGAMAARLVANVPYGI
jgi:hypothetical protein